MKKLEKLILFFIILGNAVPSFAKLGDVVETDKSNFHYHNANVRFDEQGSCVFHHETDKGPVQKWDEQLPMSRCSGLIVAKKIRERITDNCRFSVGAYTGPETYFGFQTFRSTEVRLQADCSCVVRFATSRMFGDYGQEVQASVKQCAFLYPPSFNTGEDPKRVQADIERIEFEVEASFKK